MEKKIKGTRALTLSAVLCALGVILLALGSLLQILDLTMAALASMLVIFCVIELGGKYPYLVFAVTALLAMILVPYKTAPLTYLCFLGYYPILKAILEGHFSRFWSWVLKILIFNVALGIALYLLLAVFAVFTVPATWYYFLLPLLTPVFVVYDIALTRLVSAYLFKWRHRFGFLHK